MVCPSHGEGGVCPRWLRVPVGSRWIGSLQRSVPAGSGIFILRERIDPRQALGTVLGLAGILIGCIG